MSTEISLRDLAKSQLLTLRGEVVSDSWPSGNRTSSASTRAAQKEHAFRLQNLVIDKKYKIIELLGMGGMGAVYKAHHLMLNKDVALKTFLSPNLTGNSWQRFQREAKAIAILSHKNIVQVFDFGVGENNIPYYTMEYLRGESLSERLSRVGPLPVDQAVQLFLQVCQAMSAAHNKGIIHRDLKPANIFLSREEGATNKSDLVKIVDFGIASLAHESMDDQKLTRKGTVFGSPLYMSPEQTTGAEATVRSDIYSCACALFETLTGRPPFRGDSAFETMTQHQQMPVPSLNNVTRGHDFPERLNALLAKMMAKEPRERFQSMAEVSAELQAIDKRSKGPYQKAHSPVENEQAPGEEIKTSGSFQAGLTQKQLAWVAALAAIVVAGGLGIYWVQNKSTSGRAKTGSSTPGVAQGKTELRDRAATETTASTHLPLSLIPEPNVSTNLEPPTSNSGSKHYLQNPQSGQSSDRRFFFPGKISFGQLSWAKKSKIKSGNPEEEHREALGEVILPTQTFIRLTAGAAISRNPATLSGFGPNDLGDLGFNGNYDWSDQHLGYAGRLSGLDTLNVAEINISDKCINDMQKLPKLKNLIIEQTALSGSELAKLKTLSQLKLINGAGIHSFGKVLEKLANSTALEVLQVHDCNLNDRDMKVVGTLTSLNILDISENKITDSGLAEICKLPRLRMLKLYRTKITPSSFKLLKHLGQLTDLSVSPMSPIDWVLLNRTVRGPKISVESKNGQYNQDFLQK